LSFSDNKLNNFSAWVYSSKQMKAYGLRVFFSSIMTLMDEIFPIYFSSSYSFYNLTLSSSQSLAIFSLSYKSSSETSFSKFLIYKLFFISSLSFLNFSITRLELDYGIYNYPSFESSKNLFVSSSFSKET
jgi:hypothetical protein